MDLTDANKAHIDALSLEELLRRWRMAAAGDEWFQGETGQYWKLVMFKKRDQDPQGWTAASKRIG